MGWDISLSYSLSSGKLNLAMTGIALLTFMTVHLFQFRFGETQPFKLCSPPYLVNLATLLHLRLNLFWVDYPGCETSTAWSSRSSNPQAGAPSTSWQLSSSPFTWLSVGRRLFLLRRWAFRRAITSTPTTSVGPSPSSSPR